MNIIWWINIIIVKWKWMYLINKKCVHFYGSIYPNINELVYTLSLRVPKLVHHLPMGCYTYVCNIWPLQIVWEHSRVFIGFCYSVFLGLFLWGGGGGGVRFFLLLSWPWPCVSFFNLHVLLWSTLNRNLHSDINPLSVFGLLELLSVTVNIHWLWDDTKSSM